MKMTEEIKNIMREEIEEIKNRLAKTDEEETKAYMAWKKCYSELEEKAFAEERYEMVYDPWACRDIKRAILTDEEEKAQAIFYKEWKILSKKIYEIQKELNKAKREQKRLRDIARGIDPEKTRARKNYLNYKSQLKNTKIGDTEKITEILEKMAYWEEKAK